MFIVKSIELKVLHLESWSKDRCITLGWKGLPGTNTFGYIIILVRQISKCSLLNACLSANICN